MWQLLAIPQNNHVAGNQPNRDSQDYVRDQGRLFVKEGEPAVATH
jgi:hypothetical protein